MSRGIAYQDTRWYYDTTTLMVRQSRRVLCRAAAASSSSSRNTSTTIPAITTTDGMSTRERKHASTNCVSVCKIGFLLYINQVFPILTVLLVLCVMVKPFWTSHQLGKYTPHVFSPVKIKFVLLPKRVFFYMKDTTSDYYTNEWPMTNTKIHLFTKHKCTKNKTKHRYTNAILSSTRSLRLRRIEGPISD